MNTRLTRDRSCRSHPKEQITKSTAGIRLLELLELCFLLASGSFGRPLVPSLSCNPFFARYPIGKQQTQYAAWKVWALPTQLKGLITSPGGWSAVKRGSSFHICKHAPLIPTLHPPSFDRWPEPTATH